MTLAERLSGGVAAGVIVASLMSQATAAAGSAEDMSAIVVHAERMVAGEAIAIGYPEQALWEYLAHPSETPGPQG